MVVIMEKWSQIPVRRAKWSPARAIAGDKAEGAAGLGEDLRAPKIDRNSKKIFPQSIKKVFGTTLAILWDHNESHTPSETWFLRSDLVFLCFSGLPGAFVFQTACYNGEMVADSCYNGEMVADCC